MSVLPTNNVCFINEVDQAFLPNRTDSTDKNVCYGNISPAYKVGQAFLPDKTDATDKNVCSTGNISPANKMGQAFLPDKAGTTVLKTLDWSCLLFIMIPWIATLP